MDLVGENGNRADSGQKLTKTNGNSEKTRVVSPSSDMVCGNPHQTEIDQYQSIELVDQIIKTFTFTF